MDVQKIHEKGLVAAKRATIAAISLGLENNYCGTAWATVHPATGSAIRQMTKLGIARKGTYSGAEISVHVDVDTQSMDIREEAVKAYCEVLKSYGIPAQMRSRAT